MQIKEILSNIIYKKCNYSRLLLFILIGLSITSIIYSYINIGYTNLTDFYTGTTLYLNYNKNIDKFLPYIYSVISLILYFINWEYLLQKFYPKLEKWINKISEFKPSKKWICLTIFIIFIINFRLYDAIIPDDNYHYGEVLVGNWLLNEHSLKIYVDFFPPHGIIDILPSYIGSLIFHDTTVNGVLLGNYILSYVFKFAVIVLAFSSLPFFLACIGTIIILTLKYNFLFASLYLLTIYIFIKNAKLKQNFYIYTTAICLISYFYYILTPTYGAPFIITMFIPYTYEFIRFCKRSKFMQICLFIISFILINGFIFYVFRDFFTNNFAFILQNFNANMVSFGNMGKFNLLNFIFKTTQYILIPLFIIMLFDELKAKDKDINKILLIAVLLVYPFIISSYALGRLDGDGMSRAYRTSIGITIFFLPLIINKVKFNKVYVYFISLLCVYAFFISLKDTFALGANIIKSHKSFPQQTIYRNGKSEFTKAHLENLETISSLIKTNSTEDSTFLDLTNQGALYYYLNKLPLIPYLAYYNIPTPEQDKFYAKKLEENLPDIVLLRGYNITHDSLPISLRVNNIYRTLLLSNRYIVINNDKITLLKKVDNHVFNQKEIDELEDSLGYSFIQQLPDVYGMSEKRLLKMLKEVPSEYTVEKRGLKYIITFKTPIDGKSLNYLYMKNSKKLNSDLNIKINGYDIIIKAKKKKQLIPLDVHPAIIFGKINVIQINSEKDIGDLEMIKLYKKDNAED